MVVNKYRPSNSDSAKSVYAYFHCTNNSLTVPFYGQLRADQRRRGQDQQARNTRNNIDDKRSTRLKV